MQNREQFTNVPSACVPIYYLFFLILPPHYVQTLLTRGLLTMGVLRANYQKLRAPTFLQYQHISKIKHNRLVSFIFDFAIFTPLS